MTEATEFRIDLAEEFPHLAPPIVEAVIHWTARPEKPTSAEKLKQHLEDTLKTDYPTVKPIKEIMVRTEWESKGSSTQHRDRWCGYRLETADGLQVAQFKTDGLVFSRLKPYEDWQKFEAEGKRLWEVFREFGAISIVQRLGVHFINRIPIGSLSDIPSYLQAPPRGLEKLPLPSVSFFFTSKHDVPLHPYQAEIIETVQPPTPPHAEEHGLILDIDVFTKPDFSCQLGEGNPLDDHLAKLRWLKNKIFFSLLTEDAIRRLGGELP